MNRIDKVLLIFPFLPIADLLSTLFSLNFGGEEIGILARPMLQNYGASGLLILAASASLIFFVFMRLVIHIRNTFHREHRAKWLRHFLVIPIYWFIILQGFYVSTATLNLLVPLAFPATEAIILRIVLVVAYFVLVSSLVTSQIKQLSRF